MPASDTIHDAVKNALVKDGWTITDDPFVITFLEVRLFADLGAEAPIGALRADQRIVVEAKSFRGPSLIHDLEVALGQYLLYRAFLEEIASECNLYLAIDVKINDGFFQQSAIKFVVQRYQIALLIVDVKNEEIVEWIS